MVFLSAMGSSSGGSSYRLKVTRHAALLHPEMTKNRLLRRRATADRPGCICMNGSRCGRDGRWKERQPAARGRRMPWTGMRGWRRMRPVAGITVGTGFKPVPFEWTPQPQPGRSRTSLSSAAFAHPVQQGRQPPTPPSPRCRGNSRGPPRGCRRSRGRARRAREGCRDR